ncbi:MAG: hypothetical protein MZV63_18135 [Marinilabiliales bacterium]|nr:hypothetical protein [Marinilabiliales bacterium]
MNPARMVDHFRRGVQDLESIWKTMFDRADTGATEARPPRSRGPASRSTTRCGRAWSTRWRPPITAA